MKNATICLSSGAQGAIRKGGKMSNQKPTEDELKKNVQAMMLAVKRLADSIAKSKEIRK